MTAVRYKFSNILGATYAGGSLAFTEDGNGLLSAAGNRVVYKDLVNQQSFTLGVEAPEDLDFVLVVPARQDVDTDQLKAVCAIDRGGRCLFLNLTSLVSLARVSVRQRVTAAAVSPCGRFIAMAYGRELSVFELPTSKTQWKFARVWELYAHTDRTNSISWHGLYLLTASNDCTVRLWAVSPPTEDFKPLTFVDHHVGVRAAWFSEDGSEVISVSREGQVIVWRWEAEGRQRAFDTRGSRHMKKQEEKVKKEIEEKFGFPVLNDENGTISKRMKLEDDKSAGILMAERVGDSGVWTFNRKFVLEDRKGADRVTAACYFPSKRLLAIGLTSGEVHLRKDDGAKVDSGDTAEDKEDSQTAAILALGAGNLSALEFNSDGEWIAVGVETTGTVAVWEWMSGTFIMKENGEGRYGVRSTAMLPTGVVDPFSKNAARDESRLIGTVSRNIVASGYFEGHIKIWDATSARVCCELRGLTAPVTALEFTPQLNAVVATALNGSVYAFDLLKAKAFRKMTVPPTMAAQMAPQLTSMALDSSGELVACASEAGDARVYLWSLQTGKLLDSLAGPEQPLTSLQFNTNVNAPGILAASCLDGTVHLWDVFGRAGKSATPQVLHGKPSAVALAFDPRGNCRLAVSHTAGYISFWDIESEDVLGQIDGLRDIEIGRIPGSFITADNSRKLVEKGNKYSRDANPNHYFSSIAYTGHGTILVACAKYSAKVCFYSTETYQIMHYFKLSHNNSLVGLLRTLNSKFVDDFGVVADEVDMSDEEVDQDARWANKGLEALQLPGAKVGAAAAKATKKRLMVWSVKASSDSRQLVIATSHGVFSYTLEGIIGAKSLATHHVLYSHLNAFNPVALTTETTRPNVIKALNSKNIPKALRLSLAMNDLELITAVYTRVSVAQITFLAATVPYNLIHVLLNYVRLCLSPAMMRDNDAKKTKDVLKDAIPMFQHHIMWLVSLLWQSRSDQTTDSNGAQIRMLLLMVLKQLQENKQLLGNLFKNNRELVHFLGATVV